MYSKFFTEGLTAMVVFTGSLALTGEHLAMKGFLHRASQGARLPLGAALLWKRHSLTWA